MDIKFDDSFKSNPLILWNIPEGKVVKLDSQYWLVGKLLPRGDNKKMPDGPSKYWCRQITRLLDGEHDSCLTDIRVDAVYDADATLKPANE